MSLHTARQWIVSLTKRRTLVNMGALFTASSLSRVLSALALFVLVRQLGVDAFGQYAASFSLVKLGSVFFSLGLDSWLLRNADKKDEAFSTAVGTALLIKFFLGILWLNIMAIIAPFLNQEVTPVQLILLSAAAVWLEDLSNSAWSAFKATLRNRITAWLMIGTQTVFFLITLGLALANIKSANVYLIGRIVTFIFAAGISVFVAFQALGIRFAKKQIMPTLKETMPFGFSHGLATIYERADITIIGYTMGKTAAGLYAPAVSLMTTLFLIPLAIYQVMLPVLSKMYVSKPRMVQRVGFRYFALGAGLGVFLGLGMMVIAHPLVWVIYGRDYAESGSLLVLLSGVLVFKCASFVLAAGLAAVGRQSKRVVIQAVTAVFNIVVNLLIIRTYGLTGVAYVYVFTEFLLMTGYLFLWLRWSLPQSAQNT